MTSVTEADIKELKDLINNRFDDLKQDINGLDKRLTIIETRLEEWKPAIQKIPDSLEKIGELKNWKQFGLVIITAFVSAVFSGVVGGVIGWLIRGGNRV